MAVQHGVDGALRGHLDIAMEPPHQQFANFARPPIRLVALEADDQAFNLMGQLISIPDRPPRAIGQSRTTVLLVPDKDFVAGLARYSELPAQLRHRFASPTVHRDNYNAT